LSSDKIERQINLLKGKGPEVMALCEWVNFKEDINQFTQLPYGVFQDFESGLNLLLRYWNHQEMMAISSYLTHRILIQKAGSWDESIIINQDGEFFTRVLVLSDQVLFESQGKVYYRMPSTTNVSQQKTRKAWESLLESYKRYERNILSLEDSSRIRISLNKVYQKFIYDCFPDHPDLTNEAGILMKSLKVKEKTYIGGPKFQMLSKILGFKNALRLKRILEK
jgi:hypothetical protein